MKRKKRLKLNAREKRKTTKLRCEILYGGIIIIIILRLLINKYHFDRKTLFMFSIISWMLVGWLDSWK